MERFVVINIREALLYWQGINPKVELTEERMEHIRQHHPEEFELCLAHIEPAIQSPDLILEDHRNPLTAMFIRSFREAGVNVVVKLAMSNDMGNRSFVVTVHPVGERSVRKLERKNKIVYKRTSDML